MEDLRGVGRSLLRVGGDKLTKGGEEGSGDLEADGDAVGVGDVVEGPFDLAAQVPRDPVGCLGAGERSRGGGRGVGERVEARPQPLGDERLIDARPQLLAHDRQATSSP